MRCVREFDFFFYQRQRLECDGRQEERQLGRCGRPDPPHGGAPAHRRPPHRGGEQLGGVHVGGGEGPRGAQFTLFFFKKIDV